MNEANINVGGTSNINIKHRGSTIERPTEGILAGFMYFDITLGRPIWWNGENGIDAFGNSVDTEKKDEFRKLIEQMK